MAFSASVRDNQEFDHDKDQAEQQGTKKAPGDDTKGKKVAKQANKHASDTPPMIPH
jgi:hypothetical protein